MVSVPNSVILKADDVIEPFDRRAVENEKVYEGVSGVDAYSQEQEQQIARIQPIKFCVYPEFFLSDALNEYIPRDHQENPDSYNVRTTRASSSFESFYSHLVDIIVGTALRKGVILPQEMSEEWAEFFENVDLEGESITSFAKNLFTEAINGGVAGLFTDYPPVSESISKSEEDRLSPRPYLAIIKVDDILECRYETGPVRINGKTKYEKKVTYLRIRSEKREASASNEHFEKVIPTVIVYDIFQTEVRGNLVDRVRVRVYEQSEAHAPDSYIQVDPDRFLSIDYIPFTPCYGGKKEDFCRARPLLLDIARLNLKHWSVAADLHEDIHLNASQMLTGTGIRPDEEIFKGSGRSLFSQNPDAKFGLLAPDMQGAEVTLKELARLEQSMYRLTAVAMSPTKSQAESGFAKLLDRSQSDSQLAVLVQSLEDCLNKAIKYASGYRTDKYPEISVTISKNFIPVKLHSQQVMALKTLFKDSGVMPVRLLYEMLEAGEMFEGLHNFSINDTLERMGLTGNETAVDIHGAKEKPAVDDESLIDDESVINREDSDPETDESSLETREN